MPLPLVTPEFVDGPEYTSARMRTALRNYGGLQAGILASGDLKVTQTGSASTSVVVTGGYALVAGGTSSNAGFYHVEGTTDTNTLGVNPTGAVGHASLPRLDQVIIKINDRASMGSVDNDPQLIVRLGTPTAGATLDNRNGAAALNAGELRLADMLMPAAGTTYTTANIRDRRPWARGVTTLIVGNAGGNITTTSTTDVGASLHTVPRVELTAGNVLQVSATVHMSTTAGTAMARVVTATAAATTSASPYSGATGSNAVAVPINHMQLLTTGGSNICYLYWKNNIAGTATMQNNSDFASRVAIREIVGGYGENN